MTEASARDTLQTEKIISIRAQNIYACLRRPKEPLAPGFPTIICFHGSGVSGSRSWHSFAELLSASQPILLFDRPGNGQSSHFKTKLEPKNQAAEHTRILRDLLDTLALKPPYILVAHSYGGKAARDFLQRYHRSVGGLVLAETGQEGPSQFEEEQHAKQIMGAKPVSVICANSFLSKSREVERRLRLHEAGSADPDLARLEKERDLLRAMRTEDVRLKKAQLQLTSKGKFRDVQDCGHDIVHLRPEIVVEEVKWVLEEWLKIAGQESETGPDRNGRGSKHKRWLRSIIGRWQ